MYNLQITDKKRSINFNSKYGNLASSKKPNIIAKAPNGKEVYERNVFQGTVIKKGDAQRKWVDENDTVYSKRELSFWCEGEQVSENEQTKVFEIEGYQPEQNYTDTYIISTYYELVPSNNGMKKDRDRNIAISSNLRQMYELWKYLRDNKLVARGEFCPSSRGFIASDGYIRAIQINGNKWGLELGSFKEEKIFQHLNEGIPSEVKVPVVEKKKRLKRV